MVSVKASDTAPRVAPNSGCTTGSTTTTDHIPTLPIEPIKTASASRTHAWRESGMKAAESRCESEGACTAATFVAPGCGVKPHGAILGMQMHRNRARSSFRSDAQHRTRNPANPIEIRVRRWRGAPE
jgi:hypothetical protein